MGLNEADTVKSSSILIYSHSAQSIYTQSWWQDAVLIKKVRLNKAVIKLVNETMAKWRDAKINYKFWY